MSDDAGRYALALEEARRALDRQAVDLADVRNRMTGLVGVGALAAAFIGGLAIRDDAPLTVWTVLGAVFFAALLTVAAVVLWPRKVVFTQRANVLVGWADDPAITAERVERNLALHMRKHYLRNARHLKQLTVLYSGALALLLLEVVLLLLDLRGR